jgi:pimeloyl-ACP methyl ester carboxylesterase
MPSTVKPRRQKKTSYKRFAAVVVPILVFTVIGTGALTYFLATQVVKPVRRPVLNTPVNFEQLLQEPIWDNQTWTGANGTQLNGWLMYRDQPAPFVICLHGFNANREELLDPSFMLWKAGYNVLASDLRAHGDNAALTSTLGPLELEDLKSTIQFVKSLKTESGAPRCDGRIGLYGINLGGFVALSAAASDEAVKAIAVDTVFPSEDDFLKARSKAVMGSAGPPDSAIIENGLLQSCIRFFMRFTTDGDGTQPMSAAEAIAATGDKPLLLIMGKSDPSLYPLSQEVASAAGKAQKLEYDRSRSGSNLIRQDADTYDKALVQFFSTAPGFEPPPPPDEKDKKADVTKK